VSNTAAEATHREACLAAGFVLVATAVVVFVPFDTRDHTLIEGLRRARYDTGAAVLVALSLAPALLGVVTLLAAHRGLPHLWHRIVSTVLTLPFVGVPILAAMFETSQGRMAKKPLALVAALLMVFAIVAFVRSFIGWPWKRQANGVAAAMTGAVSTACFLLQAREFHQPANLGVGAILMWTTIGLIAPLSVWMTLPRRSKNA
jgi:hypothetical protein